MKQSNATKLAYAAGFFDGEGCVRIARSNHKKNRKSPMYYLIVMIRQKDGQIMDWLVGNFGGMVILMNKTFIKNGFDKAGENWIYEWRVENIKAQLFLKSILPFSKLKKPQIELALQFQERKNQGRLKKQGDNQHYTGLSVYELTERERLKVELSAMKKIYHKAKNPNVVEYNFNSMVQD